MTTYFISRHPGAITWAARQGLAVDQQLSHLDPNIVHDGDTVIGLNISK
jgi:CRISPR-associated protein Csx16